MTSTEQLIDLLQRPQLLTEEQIADIASVVPPIQGVGKKSREMAHREMIKSVSSQLRGLYLTPVGIPELKNKIQTSFYRSVMEPGTMVGVQAAEAIGGPITQMALKTFHQSGSSKNISVGVDAMRELFNVTKERKRENMTIRFKDQHLNHDEVIHRQGDLVSLTVGDLVRDTPDIDTDSALQKYWWHEAFPIVMGRAIPQSQWVMRLTLDVNTMYSYRVDMEQVAAAIEGSSNGLVCVYSPIDEGIIDIYTDEQTIVEVLRKHSLPIEEPGTLVFLTQIVTPNLDNLQIKGVVGIKRIYPVTVPVWQIIAEENRAFTDEHAASITDEQMASNMRRTWLLVFNKSRMRTTGIGVEKIVRLCEVVGIIVYQQTEDYLVVIAPEGVEGRPGLYVQALIDADEKDEAKYEAEQKRLGNVLFRRKPTELQRAAKYAYADADGTNLRAMLSRDDVDPYHTVSSNAYEIYTTLGIEATRTFLINEIISVILYDGEYINPRHVVLLVDFMTNRGEPLPITFSGISRQPIGALELASFERAMDNFADAGGFGKKEDIRSTSTSIYVGKRAEMGTGYFDINVDMDAVRNFQEEMERNPQAQVNINDFKKTIDDITDITFGTGTIDFNEAEDGLDMMLSGETVPILSSSSVPTIKPKPPVIQDKPDPSEPKTLPLKTMPILPQQLQAVVPQFTTVPGTPYVSEPNQTVVTTLSDTDAFLE